MPNQFTDLFGAVEQGVRRADVVPINWRTEDGGHACCLDYPRAECRRRADLREPKGAPDRAEDRGGGRESSKTVEEGKKTAAIDEKICPVDCGWVLWD